MRAVAVTSSSPWTFHLHAVTWLVVLALGLAYADAVRRTGGASRRQIAATVGALALGLGLWTRLIAAMLCVELLVVSFRVHIHRGWSFTAPGGGADIVSRLLSSHLQNLLGVSVIVENRAGAAGRIGTGVVAKSDPDGYMLLVSTESSLVIAPHIGQPIGYDPPLTWAEWLVDDQREASGRPDVISFTSEVLRDPVKISGQPIAEST